MTVVTGSLIENNHGNAGHYKTITDTNANNNFFTNSPAGEYGILYTASTNITDNSGVGLIFYQAGVVALTASIFAPGKASRIDFTSGSDLAWANSWS